jgi:hypothetical protein
MGAVYLAWERVLERYRRRHGPAADLAARAYRERFRRRAVRPDARILVSARDVAGWYFDWVRGASRWRACGGAVCATARDQSEWGAVLLRQA